MKPPLTLTQLVGMSTDELQALHNAGTCLDPAELTGTMDGIVLGSAPPATLVRALRLWRGKAFDPAVGSVPAPFAATPNMPSGASPGSTGLNRVGVGIELRRFRFAARVTRSRFSDRDVVQLDHDTPLNPAWVRRFHDELVAVDDRLYLATSHYRIARRTPLVCFFALSADSTSTG